MGNLKVNLGDKKRIKINGQRVSVPYKRSNELTISNMNDTVLVETRIGVSIVWDGRGFLEVSVPSRYKGEKIMLHRRNRECSLTSKQISFFNFSKKLKISIKLTLGV